MDTTTIEEITVADAAVVTRPISAGIELGVTRGMSNEECHGDRSAVSSTQLKRMLTSPAHFLHGLDQPEESRESLLFGAVLHARLLEPATFAGRFFGEPKVNRSTKEGKALAEAFKAEAAGRTRFPADWMGPVDNIVANVGRHAKAREILDAGEAEVAIAWLDPETGVKCKIKIDWWHGAALIADVKSAVDVTWDGFSKACARLHHALSAFMYCEGVRLLTGERPEWAFIACEKEAPNTVAVYRASTSFLQRATVPPCDSYTGRLSGQRSVPNAAGRRGVGVDRPATLVLTRGRN